MLTDDQKQKYLADPTKCPFCGSECFVVGFVANKYPYPPSSPVTGRNFCHDCKKWSVSIYTLTDIEEADND